MIICGMDEVGRGALAGPLVAAATILNPQRTTLNLQDSKKLTTEMRNKLYKKIIKSGAVVAVEIISARQINTKGMGWANKEVFRRLKNKIPADIPNLLRFARQPALGIYPKTPRPVVVGLEFIDYKYIADGNLKLGKRIESVVKADAKIPEVMAASIIAKVFRDRIMDVLHEQYPRYGWQSNKGYGTKYHIAAIREHGITKYHRKKFVETALKTTHKLIVEANS